MKRRTLVILGWALLLLGSGCAGIFEFRTPEEFRGKKLKEDPPGTYAPEPRPRVRPC